MTFAAAYLPSVTVTIPQFGVVTLSHSEIAFVIGMLGYKGVKAIIFGVLKNRFGIDLCERITQRKSSN